MGRLQPRAGRFSPKLLLAAPGITLAGRGENSPKRISRIEPLNRRAVPGSAGVSPACSSFPLPTGRRPAGAPRRFMERPIVSNSNPPRPTAEHTRPGRSGASTSIRAFSISGCREFTYTAATAVWPRTNAASHFPFPVRARARSRRLFWRFLHRTEKPPPAGLAGAIQRPPPRLMLI